MARKKAVRKTVSKRTKKTCDGVCIYVWKEDRRRIMRWHLIFHNCRPGRDWKCPRPNNPSKGKKKIPPGTICRMPCIPKK